MSAPCQTIIQEIMLEIVPVASNFGFTSLNHNGMTVMLQKQHNRYLNENNNKDRPRQISTSVNQERSGSLHLLQLSGEVTCWVKPKVTSEHRASWEIQFRLEEMLVGQMSNSMQFATAEHLVVVQWKELSPFLLPSTTPSMLLSLSL